MPLLSEGGSTSSYGTGATVGATAGYRPPAKPPVTRVRRMPTAQPGPTSGGGTRPSVSAPSRPLPPNESKYLKGDVGYQQALREFALNYQNFLADKTRQTGSAKQQFDLSRTGLGEQRGRDLRDIESDFASRGLLHSGLYAGRLGEYEQDYTSNLASVQQQYDDFLRQLAAAQSQLQSQQQLETERARQEALSRRATRYGL